MDPPDGQYRVHGIYGQGAKLFGIAIALNSIVIAAMSIRFFSRRLSRCGVGLDDWVVFAAGAVVSLMTIVTTIDVFYGYGTSQADLNDHDRIVAIQMFWATQIIYKIVMCFCKLSVCIFYLRIFPRTIISTKQKVFRIANYALIGLILSYSVASVIVTIVQCTPMPRVWDKTILGSCINLTGFWYANAAYSISTDAIIVLLPFPVLWGLKTSIKDKIGLFVIFSMGFFVTGTSIARMVTLDTSSKSPDQTYGTFQSTLWTTVEANTAIIVACLPSFKTPLKWLRQKFFPVAVNSQRTIGGHPSRSGMSGSGTIVGSDTGSAYTRVPPGQLGDIAIRTDVDVEFADLEKNSRGSSLTMNPSHQAYIQAHEMT